MCKILPDYAFVYECVYKIKCYVNFITIWSKNI